MKKLDLDFLVVRGAAVIMFGCAMMPGDAMACGNGYGAKYTSCSATTYRGSYSSSYSSGGGDVGAILNGAAAILEIAPPLLNALGDIGTQFGNSIPSPSFSVPELFGSNPASEPEQPRRRRLSDDQATDCAGMRARLKPHAPNEDWIKDQMARSGCLPNGKKMALRDRLKRELDKPAYDDQLSQVLGGILNTGAPSKIPARHPGSDITGLGGR